MTHFNLETLTEDELRELNRAVVLRLEAIVSLRRKIKLMAFKVGDRVSFKTETDTVRGIVVRINQKTASIKTEDGRGWRVAPSFLKLIESNMREVTDTANVIQLSLHQQPGVLR